MESKSAGSGIEHRTFGSVVTWLARHIHRPWIDKVTVATSQGDERLRDQFPNQPVANLVHLLVVRVAKEHNLDPRGTAAPRARRCLGQLFKYSLTGYVQSL